MSFAFSRLRTVINIDYHYWRKKKKMLRARVNFSFDDEPLMFFLVFTPAEERDHNMREFSEPSDNRFFIVNTIINSVQQTV